MSSHRIIDRREPLLCEEICPLYSLRVGLFFAAYASTQNFLVLALIEVKGITPSQGG